MGCFMKAHWLRALLKAHLVAYDFKMDETILHLQCLVDWSCSDYSDVMFKMKLSHIASERRKNWY